MSSINIRFPHLGGLLFILAAACSPESASIDTNTPAPADIPTVDTALGDTIVVEDTQPTDTGPIDVSVSDATSTDVPVDAPSEEDTPPPTADTVIVEDTAPAEVAPVDTTPPPAPEPIMGLSAAGQVIAGGVGYHDFGDQHIGSPGPLVTFVIENLGTADLLLDAQNALTFVGPASTQYYVVMEPEDVVPPGGSTTFGITFAPTEEAYHIASLQIHHNAKAFNPFVIELVGNATVPSPPMPIFMAYWGCCTRAISSDGVQWKFIQDPPTTETENLIIRDMIYADGMFVGAGGAHSGSPSTRFVTTKTGATLNNEVTYTWQLAYRLAHKDGLFVAGGANGRAFFTTNKGTYWELGSITPSIQGHFTGIAVGNDMFATVNCQNTFDADGALESSTSNVLTSTDGINWTAKTIEGRCLQTLTFGNGMFLSTFYRSAMNGNASVGHCSVSPDLVTWTPCNDGAMDGYNLTNHGYLNGEFVVARGNVLYRSTDGLVWTQNGVNLPRTLRYSEALKLYLGFSYTWGTGQTNIHRGTDLTALESTVWETPMETPFVIGLVTGFGPPGFDPMKALADPLIQATLNEAEVTSGGEVALTPTAVDDFSLTTVTINNTGEGPLKFAGTPIVSITGPDAPRFTVVERPAAQVLPGDKTQFTISYRPDAAGPHEALITLESNNPGDGPFTLTLKGTTATTADTLPRFVAYGGCCYRLVSKDGIEWNVVHDDTIPETSAYVNNFRGMVAANGLFVGIGGGGTQTRLAVSSNGYDWTHEQTQAWGWLAGGGHLGDRLIAAGGNGRFAVSDDNGATWQDGSIALGGGHVRQMATGLDRVVGIGDHYGGSGFSNMAVSTDGDTWETALSDLYLSSIAYGNGVFVAAGSNDSIDPALNISNYAWSTDGLVWTEIPQLSKKSGARLLGFINGQFILRTANYYIASENGQIWHNQPFPIPSALTYGNGLYVGYDTSAERLYYGTDLHALQPIDWPGIPGFPVGGPLRVLYEGISNASP